MSDSNTKYGLKKALTANRSFLMGLSMIAIILFHQRLLGVPSGIFHYGFYGVDVFLLLSGFGCAYAMQKYTDFTFLKRRFMRLLPTCVFAGGLIVLADLYLGVEDETFFSPMARVFSLDKWYIEAILIYYLLCPVFYKIIKSHGAKGMLMICGVTMILAFGNQIVQWNVPATLKEDESFMFALTRVSWILWRLPVFLAGIYLSLYDFNITKKVFWISMVFMLVSMVTHNFEKEYLAVWPYFAAAAMPGVCWGLCQLRSFCIKIRLYRPIEILGLYSLEIYLLHEYLLKVFKSFTFRDFGVLKFILFAILLGILVYATKLLIEYVTALFDRPRRTRSIPQKS